MKLNHLTLIAKIEALQKELSPTTLLSDIDILKAFRLPLTTHLEDLHDGTLVYRLLKDRTNRPSPDLWDRLLSFAKEAHSQDPSLMAAELYFEVVGPFSSQVEKAKMEPGHWPPGDDTHRGDSDAPPNITGGAADVGGGTFLSKGEFESPEAAVEAIERAHGDPLEVKERRKDGDLIVTCTEHEKEWYVTHEGRVYEYWYPPAPKVENLEKAADHDCK